MAQGIYFCRLVFDLKIYQYSADGKRRFEREGCSSALGLLNDVSIGL